MPDFGHWHTSPPLSRHLARSNSNASTAVFSDCNSVHSTDTEPPPPNSGDLNLLIADLSSTSHHAHLHAVKELRRLARTIPENRLLIARAGAVPPLLALASDADPEVEENCITAIFNLLICEENKPLIVGAGAIHQLVRALTCGGTAAARANAACAIVRLAARSQEYHEEIARAGAIPPLVGLLEKGERRGRKDAATALYTLLTSAENKRRAVEAGAVRVLLGLMGEPEVGMVDKAAHVLEMVLGVSEGRSATVGEDGVAVLVELVESGSDSQKRIAMRSLLWICNDGVSYRRIVNGEGAIPALLAVCFSDASTKAKVLAEDLIRLLRMPNTTNNAYH